MNPNTKFEFVLNEFAGATNYNHININSHHPQQINDLLLQSKANNIILWTVDVWRYNRELKSILGNFLDKKIILIAPGYDNIKLNQNHYELSFPLYYWARYRSEQKFTPKSNDLTYGFGCLNNRPAIQRLILGFQLFKQDLLKEIIYTQNDHDVKDRSIDYTETFTLVEEYVKDIDFRAFVKLLPIEWKSEKIICDDYLVSHDAEILSYCNIVTESEVQDWPYHTFVNRPVVTEKTWKPFIAGQIPIFLAACGHLNYLKKLGFEVFEDLYPKNFDDSNIESKITSIVKIISQGKNFIRDYYYSNIKAVEHNYNLIMNSKVEKLIQSSALDFINQ